MVKGVNADTSPDEFNVLVTLDLEGVLIRYKPVKILACKTTVIHYSKMR